jgi:hypothetical protein
MSKVTVDFYLGANSENGFVSHFSQLQNPDRGYTTYIIKGGAGTGKSTLMKKIAQTCGKEEVIERIHCSSDPDSLDGVLLQQSKVNVLDGTPPHAMEPRHPLVCEQIVSLFDAFDPKMVRGKEDEIVTLTSVISGYHRRFCGMLKCANLLLDSNAAMITPFVNHAKIKKTAENLMKKICRKKKDQKGEVQIRLLSAFTPKGLYTYQDTVTALCSKVYLLRDEYQVCSDEWMRLIQEMAVDAGYDCYACYSPFHPEKKIDHILIPELSVAFLSENRFVSFEGIHPVKVIHATRFYDREILRVKKQRLNFCKKTAAEVLQEGIAVLKKAKQTHDELETYYKKCVDFEQVNQMTQRFIQTIQDA